jgi:hypothetical protein
MCPGGHYESMTPSMRLYHHDPILDVLRGLVDAR